MTFRKGHRRIFGVLLAIFLLAGALMPMGLALAIDEAGAGTPAPSAPGPTPAASSTADSPEPSAPADGGESSEMPDPTAGDAASQPPTPETPTPAPTESVDPSEMPTPTETIVPTESPAPTETTLPTETPVPTETTLPTETPVPTESPLPTLTPAPALAVTATETGFTISGEMGEAGELTLQLDGAALRAEMLTGLPEGASATAENGALLVSLPAGAFALTLTPEWGEAAGTLVLTAQLLNLTDSATLERPAPAVEVLETSPALTAALAWQGGERPAAADYPAPKLLLALDGGEPQEPTAEDLSLLGLSALPEIQVAEDLSSISLEAGALPARVRVDGAEHTAAWTLQPAALEGWLLTEEDGVWTYTLEGAVEVEITEYATELRAQVVFYDFENALGTRPETLAATLEVSLDGGAYQQPDEAALTALGLTALPQVEIAETEDGALFTVSAKTLPSRLTHTAADGTVTSHTAAWRIVPEEIEGYSLAPGMSLMSTNRTAAWTYTLEGQEYLYTYPEFLNGLEQAIYWADNNNEANARPAFSTEWNAADILTKFAALEIKIGENGEFHEVTQDDLEEIGLWGEGENQYESLATFFTNLQPDYDGGNQELTFVFSSQQLPTKVTRTDRWGNEKTFDIDWRLTPRENEELMEHYALFNYYEGMETQGRIPAGYEKRYGWYYVLRTDVTFNIQVNWGTMGTEENHEAIEEAVYGNYVLHVNAGNGISESHLLEELATNPVGEYDAYIQVEHATPGSGPASGSVTVFNTWKYHLDGSPITYTIEPQQGAEAPDRIEPDGLEDGDYFAITYDNTNAPNHSGEQDKLYPGGTILLTLTGIEGFTAKKAWLDDDADPSKRPTAEYQIWRYRDTGAEAYRNASPVRGQDGQILTMKEGEDGTLVYNWDTANDGQESSPDKPFPKYDSEGYRYIYVVREYLTYEEGDYQYKQVFGSVDEDGTIHDTLDEGLNGKRATDNTYLYYDGTLSNRRVGTAQTQATKTWDAAAYQAEFEDVAVELTLQSRPKGEDPEAEWEDTETTRTLEGFYAENLTQTLTLSVPLYDDWGRELEYRWVESDVTQEGYDTKFYQNADQDGGRFTLQQTDQNNNARIVRYNSESVIDPLTGFTTITNTIDDEIDYIIDKYWYTGAGEESVTGSYDKTPPEDWEGAITFGIHYAQGSGSVELLTGIEMDGTVDEAGWKILHDQAGNQYTYREDTPWHVIVQGLPEYDASGHAYEYVLVEQTANETYTVVMEHTERMENGDYLTQIYNGPGTGNRILVRKAWIDDGDVTHRDPVTVGVYLKADNTKIAETKLGENGLWHEIVGIGEHRADEVYILETQMGDKEVPLQHHIIDPGKEEEEPNNTPAEPDEHTFIQFAGPHHYYEATYSMTTFAGQEAFTVTNRRLGIIDLTVTKTWVDGNDKETKDLLEALEKNGLALALQLKFDGATKAGYEIDYTANTVTLGQEALAIRQPGKGADVDDLTNRVLAPAIQKITLEDATAATPKSYYFFNLPKYDLEGASVAYTVEEVVVNAQGNVVTNFTLYPGVAELLAQYTRTYAQGTYEVGHLHERDTQEMRVTNTLTETKTVQWHKTWSDRYAYATGIRPDIFLNIYSSSQGVENGKPQVVIKNYRWTPHEDIPDPENSWSVAISGLPRYDAQGYEIFYYATEHSNIDWSLIDYAEVQYYMGTEVTGTELGMDIGTQTNPSQEAKDARYVLYVGQFDNEETDVPGEHYALREDGTFINQLQAEITMQGQKVWSSLPSGWQPKDLPTVTFAVDRYADLNHNNQKDPEEKTEHAVATLKISDWTNWQNGTFFFEITHEGKNHYTVDDEGKISVINDQEANPLPKYDNDGCRYVYSLREETVEWADGVADEPEEYTAVFKSTVETGTYIARNTYDPQLGSLSFKKYLQLPGDGVYPAVRFDLYRTWVDNAGNEQPGSTTHEPGEYVTTVTWSSEKVEEAAAGNGNVATWTHTFEDLPLYAPNGSPYTYILVEDKTGFLEGYDTWVQEGDKTLTGMQGLDDGAQSVQVGNLKPTPYTYDENGEIVKPASQQIAATFYNERGEPGAIQLTGIKRWNDFGDALGLRPDKIHLTITLSRYANPQPGEGNEIPSETLTEDTDYKITWKNNDDDTWTYTITGVDDKGLEKNAPNGMPWIYTVEEVLGENSAYQSMPERVYIYSNSAQEGAEGDLPVASASQDLVNSLKTSESFSKTWENEAGESIAEDHLGMDIAVTFVLQVREDGGESWKDAETYFEGYTGGDPGDLWTEYEFAQTISGPVNQTIRGSFDDLPTVITQTAEGEVSTVSLEYRVVETAVQFGDQKYTVQIQDGKYTVTTVAGNAPFVPAGLVPSGDGDNAHTNQLKTTSLTVEKVWVGDSDNLYGSRPHDGNPSADWSVTFLIQQSTNGTDWTPVQTRNAASADPQDLTVTLYGTNEASTAETTIDNLPETDENGRVLQYRAVELQPGAEPDYDANDIVLGGNTFYDTYTVAYVNSDGTTTATNTLNTTEISAEKKWNVQGENTPAVTLHLQYWALEDGKEVWKDVKTFGGKSCTVKLDGEVDSNPAQPYYEDPAWHAVWKDLPQVLPGSKLGADGKTQYQVVEDVPSGFLQENSSGEPGNKGEFTFINVPETSYTVTKSWHTTTETEHPEVTVQLYRTTDADLVGKPAETQGVEEVKERTAELSENKLTHTFQDLPKYEPGEGDNPKGALYYYYVLETTDPDGEWEVHYDHSSETNTTTIRNVGKVTVSCTKTWHDNNDAYHTRPDSITLQLYRTTDTGENKQWVKVDSKQVQAPWTYEFKDLPYADEKGNLYTYRVAEMNGDAEIAEGGTLPAVKGDPEPTYPDAEYTVGYDDKDNKWNITNTLTETIEIPVKKTWVDGGSGANERPDSITFLLYANGEQVAEHTVKAPGLGGRIVDFLTDTGDIWEFKFTTNDEGEKLPRFDENGKIIDYTVDEIVVNGYKTTEVSITKPDHPHLGFTLVNTKMTQLTVEKVWYGTEEETMPASVTVQLKYYTTDPNVRYVPGNMQSTAVLNAGNSWKYTFTNLPQYVEVDGNYVRCTYVAEEILIDGIAVENADFTVYYTDSTIEADPNFHNQRTYWTTVVNVQNMEITGMKTWKDNNDAYHTRPDSITLQLYRTTDTGENKQWTEVGFMEVRSPWTYEFTDLPYADEKGNPYTYRVEETPPEPAENGDHYERLPEETGYNFTNVLKGTVDIPVTKIWVDNHDGWGKRPASVTIQLMQNDSLYKTLKLQKDGGFLKEIWQAVTGQVDNQWSYTFENLPRYDENGVLYVYTVKEVTPDDYEVSYDQEKFEITNTRDGDLLVEKEVTGSDGQRNRDFTFTVTLDDATIQGTYGDMTFENGVATFTLRHGQSATAEDLPAGLGYTVVEHDANTNRYRTTYTDETGTIPAGDTAVTHVENRRNRQYYPDYTEEPEPTPPRIPEESWRPPHYDDWHDVPRTGDTMNLALYVALAVVSAAGLTTLLILMRRKRR